jgi:signal transduction histidine kinase
MDVLALERQLAQARTISNRMDALVALIWGLREKDTQRALSLSEQLWRLVQTVPDDDKRQGDAHRCMATVKFNLCETTTALNHALEALKYVEKSGDRLGLMYTRAVLGSCYMKLGDYPAAQILYRQALSIAEDYQNDEEMGRLYKNIGVAMSLQGDHQEAIHCYDRALPYVETLNDEGELAKIYNNYAVEYTRLEMLKEAEYWARKAYEGFHKMARWRGMIRATINLAHIYARKGDLMQAIAYIQECIEIAQGVDIKSDLMVAYQNAGEIALMDDAPEAALDWYVQALTIAQELGEKGVLYQCHEGLYKTYKHIGDAENALHHHERFHAVKEEVFNAQNSTAWQNLEILHRTREARQEAYRQRALREADHQYYARLGEMKDDFIHSASHDLKNPLAMMKTSLYLLKRHGRIDDAKGISHMNMLDNQVNWMRDLITNILDLAWLEMGRAINTEMVEVVTFAGQVVEEFRMSAEEAQLTLAYDAPAEPLTTAIDPMQIRQVLNNLLSNAIKYTPAGGTIVVKLEHHDDTLRFDVRDTGYGIPEKAQPHIFERFYRVEDKRHQAQDGTGLGLAIVKSIVEQHGGTIELESTVDVGTTFRVILPIITISDNAEDFTLVS